MLKLRRAVQGKTKAMGTPCGSCHRQRVSEGCGMSQARLISKKGGMLTPALGDRASPPAANPAFSFLCGFLQKGPWWPFLSSLLVWGIWSQDVSLSEGSAWK